MPRAGKAPASWARPPRRRDRPGPCRMAVTRRGGPATSRMAMGRWPSSPWPRGRGHATSLPSGWLGSRRRDPGNRAESRGLVGETPATRPILRPRRRAALVTFPGWHWWLLPPVDEGPGHRWEGPPAPPGRRRRRAERTRDFRGLMLRAGFPARDLGQLYPSSLATIAFAVSLRAARPPDTPIPTISRCFSIRASTSPAVRSNSRTSKAFKDHGDFSIRRPPPTDGHVAGPISTTGRSPARR